MSSLSDNPSPARNALKHGLRSAAVLLPDDDGQEYHRLRRDLFHTYRPRTGDEAACVEAMAAHHWRMARCRRWQAVFDAQTDALLFGQSNGMAGHICETDSHVWIHKSMDCTLQESRLDRLLCRARDKLLLLQKLRRNNLIAGALEPEPSFGSFESPTDEPVRPPLGRELAGNGGGFRPEARASEARPVPRSPSADGEIEKSHERTATLASASLARVHRGVTSPSLATAPGEVASPSLARGTGRASGQGESRAPAHPGATEPPPLRAFP